MIPSPFCRKCGKRVEWHLTRAGRKMPIDPDPVEDGRFQFGAGLRLDLVRGSIQQKRRRFDCHWDTSPGCKPAPRETMDEGEEHDDDDEADRP